MKIVPAILEDERVRLEPLAEAHREGLRKAAREPRIWTWMLMDASGAGFDAMFDHHQRRAVQGEIIAHAVRRRPEGDLVGMTCFFLVDLVNDVVEIGGTWYAPAVWAGPVNPACKRLLLARAFDCGAGRVELKTDALNARSRAAIAKLGASFEGVLRRRQRSQFGRMRDTAMFSIVREEWPRARAGLEARLAHPSAAG